MTVHAVLGVQAVEVQRVEEHDGPLALHLAQNVLPLVLMQWANLTPGTDPKLQLVQGEVRGERWGRDILLEQGHLPEVLFRQVIIFRARRALKHIQKLGHGHFLLFQAFVGVKSVRTARFDPYQVATGHFPDEREGPIVFRAANIRGREDRRFTRLHQSLKLHRRWKPLMEALDTMPTGHEATTVAISWGCVLVVRTT